MIRTVLLLCLTLTALVPAQSAKYAPKGTGETTVKFSSPRYRDELMEQIRPGLEWRLGAGTATTMETAAAWVWKNDVVFPGNYVLTARCETDDQWSLIVRESSGAAPRGRGGRGGGGRGAGGPSQEFAMARTTIDKKALQTEKMVIDVRPAIDKARRKLGGTQFRVRFGKHSIATEPDVLPVIAKKGKLQEPYVLEFVKYHSEERIQKAFDGTGEPLVLARLTLPQSLIEPPAPAGGNQGGGGRPGGRGGRGAPAIAVKPKPARATLVLIPGETPTIELRGDVTRTLTGERKGNQSKTKRLKSTVSKKALSVQIGATRLVFPLAKDSFTRKELGGTTGK